MKQEQETSAPPDKQAQPVKAVKTARPVKNLYEPYVTPPILYHAIRWFAIFVFHLATRIHLRGRYNVPAEGPFILAANHLSWTDIPLVPLHLRRKVVYMAKEEYFSSKIAWLVRFLGAFPVKRGEGDRQALRAAEEQLKKGNILVIFPEGTRSRTRTLARAHAGMGMIALRSGVPVVPVAIWGSENALKKLRTPVTISYGKPMTLKPKGAKITRDDIDEATQKVMHKIAEMLPPEYRGVYSEVPGTEPPPVEETVL
ncbi:MAG: lysophospholipid acyltransferase family protein [Ktedonobacteraceae bacterium]